jgi:ATP-dependent Clp protease ATP-binding subunit ClpA
MITQLRKEELQLYKPKFRNRTHARMEFSDWQKELNRNLRKQMPADLCFSVAIRDHFLDRLIDREADSRHVKKLIEDTIQLKMCEILFFGALKKDFPRMVFTDSIHHVMTTWSDHNRTIILRSYVLNDNRHVGLNPEFTLNPHI